MSLQIDQVPTRFETFRPASAEECRTLVDAFPAIDLDDYVQLVLHSNGLGEVFDEGRDRFVHNMLILPVSKALDESGQLFSNRVFALGRPGIDGITFSLLPGNAAVFAHYPIDDEFVAVADSLSALLTGWASNSIRL
ncbi:hypothetical protein DBR12_13820 [Acidovorax sp. HMWF029]|uniref:hypothetical protein n=1 Tax=Acidovorax sp. HMWF029 TaxID=2056863 RepID=UPI000D340714|nr:hypothetical protein [Acidovorax sp. HMWF029]PTT18903.1 hypothetical protein DBR12_13820 [Acidovorax sp. HMWF029]